MGIFDRFFKRKKEPEDLPHPVEVTSSKEMVAFINSAIWDIKMALNTKLLPLNRELKRIVYHHTQEQFTLSLEDAEGEQHPSLYLIWKGKIPQFLENLPDVNGKKRLATFTLAEGGIRVLFSFLPDTYKQNPHFAFPVGKEGMRASSLAYLQPEESALKTQIINYLGKWLEDYIRVYLIPQVEAFYQTGF